MRTPCRTFCFFCVAYPFGAMLAVTCAPVATALAQTRDAQSRDVAPRTTRSAKKTRPAVTAGTPKAQRTDFIIEATGEGPELSDVPVEPWRYFPENETPARDAAKALLGTLSDPRQVLGLPEGSLEPAIDGLVPSQSSQREGLDQ